MIESDITATQLPVDQPSPVEIIPSTIERPRLLIEEWLPIAALGEESVRERRSMTALPPTYYLHVWWARRPLVASRAAFSPHCACSAMPPKVENIMGINKNPMKVSSGGQLSSASVRNN